MFEQKDSQGTKLSNVVAKFFIRLRRKKLQSTLSAILGLVGFLLSPLTWWNDVFVNAPLAWLFAYGIGRILFLFTEVSQMVFTALFGVGYLLSNILGFLLLHASVVHFTGKENISHKNQLIVTIIYTLIFLTLMKFNVIQFVAPTLSFFPSFVF